MLLSFFSTVSSLQMVCFCKRNGSCPACNAHCFMFNLLSTKSCNINLLISPTRVPSVELLYNSVTFFGSLQQPMEVITKHRNLIIDGGKPRMLFAQSVE